MSALKVLNLPTQHWDALIIHIVTSKLDNSTRRSWEAKGFQGDLPTYQELTDFLKEKCRVLESMELNSNTRTSRNTKEESTPNTRGNTKAFAVTGDRKCPICKQSHLIYSCPMFLQLSVTERLNSTKRSKLCVNCLSSGHFLKGCKSSGCRKCGKLHHTLLHFQNSTQHSNHDQEKMAPNAQPTPSTSFSSSNALNTYTPCTFTVNANSTKTVLLSTAVVKVFDVWGKSHTCRILLDSGSQSNFISRRLAQVLRLPTENISTCVSGINQTTERITQRVLVNIRSTITNFQAKLSCLVLPRITGDIPSTTFDANLLNIPENLTLADYNFNSSKPIDLLVGADIFWDILSVGQIKLGRGLPVLQKTQFGWIISGPLEVRGSPPDRTHCHLSSNLETQLKKFWELEECPVTKLLSDEESSCETHFVNNVQQGSDGHFIVALPLKHSVDKLGDSRTVALNRFLGLEQRLEKNLDVRQQYVDFMVEYENLGHMSLALNQNDNSGFFLPHHPVFKASSTTTKLRVVFDASAKSSSGYSLNDLLMTGPNVQDNLFNILLRFRSHAIVLSADIEKMYRQVNVHEKQRSLQKILWRKNKDDNVLVYELNTVTYGTSAAAFLATRALQQVALLNASTNPRASQIIQQDFYVDDLLTGGETIEEVMELKHELHNILSRHGFRLRKWASNERDLREDSQTNCISLDHGEPHKTLGLLWNMNLDTLDYSITKPEISKPITKRSILSSIAQVFDPLGLLAPVTITAKIILQALWRLKMGWDESIPMELHTKWSIYRTQLTHLNTIRIPRLVLCGNAIHLQLHGFCDAAETGYGGCVYIRSSDTLGNISSRLLCAKTRVAPVKHLTIPRLELCGALLLSELMDMVVTALNINFQSKTYWCDSTIVLCWLNTSPHLLKTFVANRISQIQTRTTHDNWRYIRSKSNPADLLTRGIAPLDLLNSRLWFDGPSWFSKCETEWPKYSFDYLEHSEANELRNITLSHMSTSPKQDNSIVNMMYRHSRLLKLCRTFAYVLRFKENLLKGKELPRGGELTSQEIAEALVGLVRIVQQNSFKQEYDELSSGRVISVKSKILKLNPFFDQTSRTIRVGGRIRNSDFDYDKKFPMLLPVKHHLTVLIVRNEHLTLMHAGPQAMLASLRERFWPIDGRNLVRKIYHDCITCFKFNAASVKYLMGNLPRSRITPSRPFSVSGVDYAGPFLLRDRKGRNFKTTKAYIALFICFATKALHLELVSDLTTQAFMAALYRFMSRRGKCSQLYSDQGTTFVGANNELKAFMDTCSTTIFNNLANEGISWNFIPPRAPHFGGLWESGVKSVKHHLKRVVGTAKLTFEEFNTVICQIEACLNSRPICPLSNEPDDPFPLTPAHFLIGEPLTTAPQVDVLGINENRLSKYQQLQRMVQHFWSRWTKEYIAQLQTRTKWKQVCQDVLKPGILVIVKEDGLPPLKWRIGRIEELHPGGDNVVRVVTVRTATGSYRRPVTKCSILPNQDLHSFN